MHKTCTGIKKKQKKQSLSIYSGLGVYRFENFGYFGYFDACAGFVKIMLCFFLFFLMLVQVLWRSCCVFFCFFWCLCRFCDSNLHKTCTGIKKNKKTKPLDAQNLHRHQKKQKKQSLSIYSGLGVYRFQNFGYFGYFDACAGFVKIMLCFFYFFWCLCMFCQSLPGLRNKKLAFHQRFRPFRCIKHCKSQCFVLIFFQKPPPHGGPLS